MNIESKIIDLDEQGLYDEVMGWLLQGNPHLKVGERMTQPIHAGKDGKLFESEDTPDTVVVATTLSFTFDELNSQPQHIEAEWIYPFQISTYHEIEYVRNALLGNELKFLEVPKRLPQTFEDQPSIDSPDFDSWFKSTTTAFKEYFKTEEVMRKPTEDELKNIKRLMVRFGVEEVPPAPFVNPLE